MGLKRGTTNLFYNGDSLIDETRITMDNDFQKSQNGILGTKTKSSQIEARTIHLEIGGW